LLKNTVLKGNNKLKWRREFIFDLGYTDYIVRHIPGANQWFFRAQLSIGK